MRLLTAKFCTAVLLTLSFVSLGHSAFADGLGHKGDRYIGDKVVLTLTQSQIQQILAFERKKLRKWYPVPRWAGTKITLTAEQKVALVQRVGFSPSVLKILSPRAAFEENGCFFYNTGIHYQTDRVDVPTWGGYLLPDAEAKRRDAGNGLPVMDTGIENHPTGNAKKAWWRFW